MPVLLNNGRRQFLKSAAGLVGSSMIPRIVRAGIKDPVLSIGYLPITDATPLLIAHSLGYYRDEGLLVDRPVMVRSWKVLSESFVAGKFNLTHLLFPIPVWMRFRHQIPVKVLAWDHTNGSALTVHKNSGIKGFEDLGGKQIAVPFWYSMHNIILQIGLKAKGLKPVIKPQNKPLGPDEVNLFILPPPEMPPALLGRKIDGFIVAEPFNALAELKLKARIMRFTGDIWKNHPCCVVVSHESLTRNEPAFIQKAVNAVVRAQAWCTKNPGETAHLLSRDGEGYLPVPESVLKRIFVAENYYEYSKGPKPRAIMHPEWQVPRIGFQPYPYPSATRFIISHLADTLVEGNSSFLNQLDINTASADLVDDRFVVKALENTQFLDKFSQSALESSFSREEIIEID